MTFSKAVEEPMTGGATAPPMPKDLGRRPCRLARLMLFVRNQFLIPAAIGLGAMLLITSPSQAQDSLEDSLMKLYEQSAFTHEDVIMNQLLEAEAELLACRFLSERGKVQPVGSRKPPQFNWERELGKLKSAVMPIARKAYVERVRIVSINDLSGKAAFVREYLSLLGSAIPAGLSIRLDDGTTAGQGGYDAGEVPAILAFHKNAAVKKWRILWPDLKVYATQMAALQYRLVSDPALHGAPVASITGARLYEQAHGGRVINEEEWRRVTEGRLGYTLAGMNRFALPLGTELSSEHPGAGTSTIIRETHGGTVVVSQRSGVPLEFKYLDARWGRDLARRLSPEDLKYIDDGLTASYDAAKQKWFAPLGLEWDAYVAVQAKINRHSEMQALFRDFSTKAQEAMQRAWAREQ